MDTNDLIGVTLAISGGTVQAFGFMAQKLGHNKINAENEDRNKEEQKSVLTKWIWWLGIIIYTMGGAMDSVSLNYAAQSIIAPLDSIKLGTVAVLSHFILKERMKIKDVIAILIIIAGVVTVVMFGPSGDADVDIKVLRVYFQATPYIVTVSILTALTLMAYIGSLYYERVNFKDESNEEITHGRNFLKFAYIWIGCFFSSNNVLFIKASVSIIISSFGSSEEFKINTSDYLSYILIALAGACMLLMEFFRQKALSHFGALVVIPSFIVISMIMTLVIGLVYFEEYKTLELSSALLFALGTVIVVIGVLILSLDIGKIWAELYDDWIKVAGIDYEEADFKYAKTVCVGGPISEEFSQYWLTHAGVGTHPHHHDVETKTTEMVENAEKGAE
eukprot:161783_1